MGKISKQTNNYDLEDLYNQAIWLNPDIRSKMLEIERQIAVQQQQEATRVAKSQRVAKVNVKSSPSDSVAIPEISSWTPEAIGNVLDREIASRKGN